MVTIGQEPRSSEGAWYQLMRVCIAEYPLQSMMRERIENFMVTFF